MKDPLSNPGRVWDMKETKKLAQRLPDNPFAVPRQSVQDDLNLSKGGLHVELEDQLAMAKSAPHIAAGNYNEGYIAAALSRHGMSMDDLKKLPKHARRGLVKQLMGEFKRARKDSTAAGLRRDAALEQLFDSDKPFEKMGSLKESAGGLVGRDSDNSHVEDVEEIVRRFEGDIVLERCQSPSLHHFSDYFQEGRIEGWPELFSDATPFLVEHDWAKAFNGVEGFDGGEIQLPFDIVCFEFRVKGVRILVFISSDEESPYFYVAMGINHRWYIDPGSFRLVGNKWQRWKTMHSLRSWTEQDNLPEIRTLYDLLAKQIHAVCVMLDAEIAVHTPVRSSDKLSERRVKQGKTKLKNYHVVSLNKRSRSDTYSGGDGTGTRKRMHFRRGHWRHYADHRTWIKWLIVNADYPELGFVDKHYKL